MTSNLQIQGLSHQFGRTEALKSVDLQVGAGVFGLLGPNGAGKTTLLRIIATVLKPSIGTINALGYNLLDRGQRRKFQQRLGYLPQSFGYYPNFTVAEFVEYFALLKEVPAQDVRTRVAWAIERVGLEDSARQKLKTLSGGMLRRVGIAQAIVNDPAVLLLDEPTAGLDPEQRVGFRVLLREIGTGGVVIVSTHLVEDVAAACSEVALMHEGRMVFHGTPAALVDQGKVESALGDTPLERGYNAVLGEARQGAGT